MQDIRQKARIKGVVEGDENSKFFHCLVNNKFMKNQIYGLNTSGSWVEDTNAIKECTTGLQDKPRFLSHLVKKIFLQQEIKQAVWSCGSNKAPGPDGFNFYFIKKNIESCLNQTSLGQSVPSKFLVRFPVAVTLLSSPFVPKLTTFWNYLISVYTISTLLNLVQDVLLWTYG